MAKRPDPDSPIEEILRRLRSAEAGSAWVGFLDHYGQRIMSAVHQFEYDRDRANECFLFVCEKLVEDDFRRLLKFDTRGCAAFSTWLTSVVFNLCVDWHRREFGRVRLLPAISALSEFDQSVYRLVMDQGATREDCFQTLRMGFPDLTREAVGNALGRIHQVLTPRQRWQIGVQARRRDRGRSESVRREAETAPNRQPGPEAVAESSEELQRVQRALSQLPPEERLLIYWRFEQGLPLRTIARLARLGDTNRAWRHVQRAVEALMQHVRKARAGKSRKT